MVRPGLRAGGGMELESSGDLTLLPPSTRRSLPMALLRAREVIMAHFRPMLARHDITEQQLSLIHI